MIFKLAHFSDSHLGYRAGKLRNETTLVNQREQDGYDAYNEVIDDIIINKPDVVLCSGDIFHSPSPTTYTIHQAQLGLDKLVENNLPFYNIAGNHDSTDNVYDVPSNIVLDQPRLNLFSYSKPYEVKEVAEGIVFHFVSHHGFLEQDKTFKHVNPIDGKFNILVTHGSVFDSAINAVLHTEGEPREVVITEDLMNKNWDYTLMGHIHERGWVHSKDRKTDTANRKQFYGGSLIRRGFSDKACPLDRGWTMWTIDTEKRTMTPEFHTISQRPQYDLVVFCKDREVYDINKEIKREFDKINFDENPILRITLVELEKSLRNQIDFKKHKNKTDKCLSFNHAFKTQEVFINEIDKNSFNFDLITAYKNFINNNDFKYKKDDIPSIRNKAILYLQKGQEKVMS